METTDTKSFEECCKEVAKKYHCDNWEQLHSEFYLETFLKMEEEAAHLYASGIAKERDDAQKEINELKKEAKHRSEVLRQMIDINMANQAFDDADNDWRMQAGDGGGCAFHLEAPA